MKRNRTLLGILSILLALGVCFGLMPVFNKMLAGKTEIVRAATSIPQGIQITESMLTTVTVGSYGLPEGIITAVDKANIVGKYATVEICKDDYLLPEKLEDELKDAEHAIASLDGSKWAVSVEVTSLADSVSAKIKGGDVVSVIAVEKDQTTGTIYPELQYIEVIAATNSDTIDISEVGEKKEDNTPKTVTFLANRQQAQLLARLSSEKNAHLAIVCRKDNTELKQQLLAEQERFMAEAAAQPAEETTHE